MHLILHRLSIDIGVMLWCSVVYICDILEAATRPFMLLLSSAGRHCRSIVHKRLLHCISRWARKVVSLTTMIKCTSLVLYVGAGVLGHVVRLAVFTAAGDRDIS